MSRKQDVFFCGRRVRVPMPSELVPNSQDGNWISADTISRIVIWKIWSEHSLNPVENAVSEIDILVFYNERLQHHHSGSHEVNKNI